MHTLWIRLGAVATLSSSVVACGSAPDASTFAEDPTVDDSSVGADGSIDSGTSTDATPGTDTGTHPGDTGGAKDTSTPPVDTNPPPPEDTGPGPLTIDNVCERLADAICMSSTRSCCTARGVPYAAAGCRDNVKSFCGDLVDDVKAGDRTFDPSKFEPCAAAWKSLTTTCSVPTLTYAKTYGVCNELLNGTMDPGAIVCTEATDCKAAPSTLPSCSDTGSCRNFLIVGKDQPCNYDGDTIRLCDYGLYCTFGSPTSKCQTAHSLGSGGCFGASDPSCGWGNRCDATNHCAVGLAMGSLCTSDLQCSSWSCNTGRCTDPNSQMAVPSTCGGG